jgi:hypothetical protein
MSRFPISFLLAATVALTAGCATAPKVERTDVSETIDLSGEWNDSDSRLVAEEMMKDALQRPWISEFQSGHGAKPRVIVGTISNKSYEHINTETFVKDLERELTNSGQVKFVAGRSPRGTRRPSQKRLPQNRQKHGPGVWRGLHVEGTNQFHLGLCRQTTGEVLSGGVGIVGHDHQRKGLDRPEENQKIGHLPKT